MKNNISNPCIKCGKQRVLLKTHEEFVGKSRIVYTQTVCPDPKCQEVVNVQLMKEENARKVIRINNERRVKELQDKRKKAPRKRGETNKNRELIERQMC